jgi:CDP-diacylglycerol--glycerol-3-phosphate 3-phosphatidyltransferase
VTDTPAKPSNWNLPNAITIVRILFAPAFLWLLLADNGADGAQRWISGALFAIGIATDGIDGWIARSRGLVTELGKLLDPIADKVLTGAALVGLSIVGDLWWWVTVVILAREIGITVYRFAVIRDGVIPASRGGKLKTLFQGLAISLALLPFWTLLGDWVHWVNGVLMAIALVLTVLSGLDYAWNAVTLHRRAAGEGRADV